MDLFLWYKQLPQISSNVYQLSAASKPASTSMFSVVTSLFFKSKKSCKSPKAYTSDKEWTLCHSIHTHKLITSQDTNAKHLKLSQTEKPHFSAQTSSFCKILANFILARAFCLLTFETLHPHHIKAIQAFTLLL